MKFKIERQHLETVMSFMRYFTTEEGKSQSMRYATCTVDHGFLKAVCTDGIKAVMIEAPVIEGDESYCSLAYCKFIRDDGKVIEVEYDQERQVGFYRSFFRTVPFKGCADDNVYSIRRKVFEKSADDAFGPVAVNAQQLRQALNPFGKQAVNIYLTGEHSPILLKGKQARAAVMPLKRILKEETK